MKNLIRNELEFKGGIHYLKDRRPFHYSDGSEIEKYIHKVIKGARDISSGSRELESYIKDWPSRYHFSRERPLAYKSLNLPSTATVLEVGSGCGAITRFLGENVAHVLALEGSPHRAAIARERSRDLTTVSVLCASFEDVVIDGKFDFVICNGVLEYARMFIHHEHPARELIRRLASLLKPGGSLVIAIENKFGLRYFSSGKEEHTNILFDGIEGYARFPSGPSTFGHAELQAMLREHCASVETFLPLPDYKLPSALIRAELLDEVNCADLFATMERRDFGTYVAPRMHERLVWHELQKNGLMREFANSFFMIAGKEKLAQLGPDWLGDIYSINRHDSLAVRTTISRRDDGIVQTTKTKLALSDSEPVGESLSQNLEGSVWVNGVSIHTLIVRALLRGDPNLSLADRLREPILAWWDAVVQFGRKDGTFQGKSMDCIWQNAVVNGGKAYFIDREWEPLGPVDPMLIVYRSVANFVTRELSYLDRWHYSCRGLSEMKLMYAVARIIGIKPSLNSIIGAMDADLQFLESVQGARSIRLKRFARLFAPLNALTAINSSASRLRGFSRIPRKVFERVVRRL